MLDETSKSFVERAVEVATVILQGSKHILFHNCYQCKKVKPGFEVKIQTNTLCQCPQFFCVSGAAPGFVSQITDLVFWFIIFGESC